MTYKNIFSMSISPKRKMSMKRKFFVFSTMVFLLITALGSMVFTILMKQILHTNAKEELVKTVELERYKMDAAVNAKIAIVVKMANSPLISKYFSFPGDPELEKLAFNEIDAYSFVLAEKTLFWINVQDNLFYTTSHKPFKVNPELPENDWYNKTLYGKDAYVFNINYNADLDETNLWLNAPVYNEENKPIGIVGAGVNLSNFINNIYANYSGPGDLYLFNEAREITGALDIDLVNEKTSIEYVFDRTGSEILEHMELLKNDTIIYFDLDNTDGVAVIGTIPSLNWYIVAVHCFSAGEYLQTGMPALFAVMLAIIFSILVVLNIFVAKLMEPFYRIVNGISRISEDFDLNQQNEAGNKNEIETLGELVSMTLTDQLTGIYNRRFFDGSMKSIIRSLSRVEGKLSILMIDVDCFKKYNDTYGHDMGDKCLKKVATALSEKITREDDFLARYGGEEFVVVLPNTDENGALLVAEKMLNSVYECKIPHEKSDAAPFVTVSIGGTTGCVKYTQNAGDFVECADAALYKSKQNGRNRYTFERFKAQ